MWGKAGAHTLWLAGNLHMLWVGEDQEISVELMQTAAVTVDQCLQETDLFYNQPADRALRYMQHINSFGQEHGEVTYKLCHAKATWIVGAPTNPRTLLPAWRCSAIRVTAKLLRTPAR